MNGVTQKMIFDEKREVTYISDNIGNVGRTNLDERVIYELRNDERVATYYPFPLVIDERKYQPYLKDDDFFSEVNEIVNELMEGVENGDLIIDQVLDLTSNLMNTTRESLSFNAEDYNKHTMYNVFCAMRESIERQKIRSLLIIELASVLAMEKCKVKYNF